MTLITPLIQKTPGVCGGSACVRETRIAVWTLQRLKERGLSDEQLLADFPTLLPADLPVVWDYARENADEIQAAIARNRRTH